MRRKVQMLTLTATLETQTRQPDWLTMIITRVAVTNAVSDMLDRRDFFNLLDT